MQDACTQASPVVKTATRWATKDPHEVYSARRRIETVRVVPHTDAYGNSLPPRRYVESIHMLPDCAETNGTPRPPRQYIRSAQMTRDPVEAEGELYHECPDNVGLVTWTDIKCGGPCACTPLGASELHMKDIDIPNGVLRVDRNTCRKITVVKTMPDGAEWKLVIELADLVWEDLPNGGRTVVVK